MNCSLATGSSTPMSMARDDRVRARWLSEAALYTVRVYAWCPDALPAALTPPNPTITGNRSLPMVPCL